MPPPGRVLLATKSAFQYLVPAYTQRRAALIRELAPRCHRHERLGIETRSKAEAAEVVPLLGLTEERLDPHLALAHRSGEALGVLIGPHPFHVRGVH